MEIPQAYMLPVEKKASWTSCGSRFKRDSQRHFMLVMYATEKNSGHKAGERFIAFSNYLDKVPIFELSISAIISLNRKMLLWYCHFSTLQE